MIKSKLQNAFLFVFVAIIIIIIIILFKLYCVREQVFFQ